MAKYSGGRVLLLLQSLIPFQKEENSIKFRVQSKILYVQLQNSTSTLSVPGPGSPT